VLATLVSEFKLGEANSGMRNDPVESGLDEALREAAPHVFAPPQKAEGCSLSRRVAAVERSSAPRSAPPRAPASAKTALAVAADADDWQEF
jgi:hypothetical protein